MPNSSAPHASTAQTAPSWRALGLLGLAVLTAHALVLRSSPRQFGPALDPSLRHTRAFVTRNIALPPAAEIAAPADVAVETGRLIAKPAVKPAAKQILKKKVAPAHESPAQAATDLIASAEPEPPFVSAPQAPASASGGSAAIIDMLDPAPAAVAPARAAASAAVVASATGAASAASAASAARAASAVVSAASSASATALPPIGPSLTPLTALALPPSTRLEYKMTGLSKGLTYYANAELVWNNAGSSYEASMTVSALFLGSRSMGSSGLLGAEGLAPTRFSDKSRTEVAAHFEREKGQISFSANTPTVPWVKGAQDRMSIILQLAGALAGNPAGFAPGTAMTIYTVGPRDAEPWTFEVQAAENLDLPYGELSTVKLSRQPRREFDQKIELWYAPTLGYLPVRTRITQHSGDFVDQQLSAVAPL